MNHISYPSSETCLNQASLPPATTTDKQLYHYTIHGPRQSPYPPPNRGDYAASLAIKNEICSRCPNSKIVTLSLKFDSLTPTLVKEINNNATVLVIGGGGLYSPKVSESGWYLNCQTRLLEQIQVPIVLSGLGYNQALQGIDEYHEPLRSFSKKAIESIKNINDLSALTSVRDKYTKELLIKIGVCETKIQLLPDPAAFLFNQPLAETRNMEEKYIGINLACHGNHLRSTLPNIIEAVSGFLKRDEFTDCRIIFISHSPDDTFISGLLTEMGVPIYNVVDTNDFSELRKNLEKCSFILAHKMHVSILGGLGLGIPFISLNYDIKQQNFLDYISYPAPGINTSNGELSTTSPTKLYHKLKNIGLTDITNHLNNFKQRHIEKHNLFYDQVASFLKTNNSHN